VQQNICERIQEGPGSESSSEGQRLKLGYVPNQQQAFYLMPPELETTHAVLINAFPKFHAESEICFCICDQSRKGKTSAYNVPADWGMKNSQSGLIAGDRSAFPDPLPR